jgi:hypothetical protein
MEAATPPRTDTLPARRRRLPARPALRRAAWVVVDLAATAAFAAYALHALL